MIGPKGEKVCLISCSEMIIKEETSDLTSRTAPAPRSIVATRQSGADAAAVDGAVTGAGLVHNVVKT